MTNIPVGDNRLCEIYDSGHSMSEIAELTGVSIRGIRLAFKRVGHKVRSARESVSLAYKNGRRIAREYDLTGQRFGRYTVVRKDGKRPNGRKTLWLCKCDCGKYGRVATYSLRNGNSTSCGCLKAERLAASHTLPHGIASQREVFSTYRSKCKTSHIEFSLTREQFFELVSRECFYCGDRPSNLKKSPCGTGDFVYQGIDRKDNTKGYTPDNCVPCCDVCNKAKRNMKYHEFLKWINRVIDHNIIKKKRSAACSENLALF